MSTQQYEWRECVYVVDRRIGSFGIDKELGYHIWIDCRRSKLDFIH